MIELVNDHFSERTSHLPLRTLHQAIDPASNPFDPLPHYPWPGGMREAMKSGHRALGAKVGAVWWETVPLTKPDRLSRSDITLPTGAARFRRPS